MTIPWNQQRESWEAGPRDTEPVQRIWRCPGCGARWETVDNESCSNCARFWWHPEGRVAPWPPATLDELDAVRDALAPGVYQDVVDWLEGRAEEGAPPGEGVPGR